MNLKTFFFLLFMLLLSSSACASFGVSPSVIETIPGTIYVVNGDSTTTIHVLQNKENDMSVYPSSLRLEPYERGQFYIEGAGNQIEILAEKENEALSIIIPIRQKIEKEKNRLNLFIILIINGIAILAGIVLWKKKQ